MRVSGDGGAATSASLAGPSGVALDAAGNLFIADQSNQRIRRVDGSTGIITTVAGNGTSGFSGDGGAATSASLASPIGVALDAAGNLFIADQLNHRIRRVDADADPCESAECSAYDTACATASCDPSGAPDNCDILTPLDSGTECRASADICDVAEVCDGVAAECPADGFASAATTCRAAADVCDVAEACTGSSAACPADGFESAATVCRAAAGLCDVAESCTGSGPSCPTDAFAPPATVCNAGSGDLCDPDETCTGTSAACPADTVASTGTVCRAGSGDLCDPDEVCSGSADDACPVDTIASAGTVCNPGSGDLCDPDEVCSGSADDACPSDTVASADTLCRGLAGPCDAEDFCSGGANAACPADAKSTALCRASAGECDVDDFCDGVSGDCPADEFQLAGFTCGDGTDTNCTDPDSCDGFGACLTNNEACALVTDSSLCPFDVNPDQGVCVGGVAGGSACLVGDPLDACVVGSGLCVPNSQFRVVFTPDGKIWPGYKLNASNPGQFFYNLFYEGIPNTTVPVTIDVAYPFVMQGATTVHVYDGAQVEGDAGCLLPPADSLASSDVQIGIDDYVNGTADATLTCDMVCDPAGMGSCRILVDVPVPDSGIAYVNVHLDYGLKGTALDANVCGDGIVDRYDAGAPDLVFGGGDALVNEDGELNGTGDLALANFTTYAFSHTDDGVPLFSDAVENVNVFKKIAGALGSALASSDGSAAAGVSVELVRVSTGETVAAGQTDEDGYYTIPFKHTGKQAMYTVILGGAFGLEQDVQLNGNGWAEVNFDVFTGTSTGEFNLDSSGSGGNGKGGGPKARKN